MEALVNNTLSAILKDMVFSSVTIVRRKNGLMIALWLYKG